MMVSTNSEHTGDDKIPKIQNVYLQYYTRLFDFFYRSSLVKKKVCLN